MLGRLGNRGDTIVEVLIAAAVVSMLLTGAYAITNRSSQQIQASQERGEATKIASQAMERLNTAVSALPALTASSITFPTPFCLDTNAALVSGAPCTTGLYRTDITREPGTQNEFNVRVSWQGLNGVNEQVIFSYYASPR